MDIKVEHAYYSELKPTGEMVNYLKDRSNEGNPNENLTASRLERSF
jgi:hypothetical protein